VQQQGFEDLGLEQRAQVIGSKIGVVGAQSPRCHARREKCRDMCAQRAELVKEQLAGA
jgi:hypothetical protein